MGINCSKTRIFFFIAWASMELAGIAEKSITHVRRRWNFLYIIASFISRLNRKRFYNIPLYFFLSQFIFIFIPYKVGIIVFDIVDQCIAQEKQTIFPYKDRTSHSQFGVSWCALNVAKFRSITKSLIFRGEHNHKLYA